MDFGFLHCVDEDEDFDELINSGIFDYIKKLKEEGKVHHIGFSSHTPSVANRVLDTEVIDMMMFSINPAYDLEQGDELGIGSTSERAALFRRCESMGVGISVMKPFHGGKLLDEKTSPFHTAMTRFQCIQYALDRPGVLAVVPGVRDLKDLNALIGFADAPEAEKDYSVIGEFTPQAAQGNCVYCNHCQPCPAGIDVGLVNKYYDLALAGDHMAANHYEKLAMKADACIGCGHCDASEREDEGDCGVFWKINAVCGGRTGGKNGKGKGLFYEGNHPGKSGPDLSGAGERIERKGGREDFHR